MQVHEGRPLGQGRRIAVAVSRFNQDVTSRLLDGALSSLRGAGVADDDVEVVHVPGAFELPLTAHVLAGNGCFDAVVALGAVIKGETDHYDYICDAVAHGLVRAATDNRVPVLFGVLTCATEDQALARAGGTHGNKGADVALDALRMVDVIEKAGAVRAESGS